MRAREFTKSKIVEGVDELFEINMSPKNLERLATNIPGARVGIEFEMIVPNIGDSEEEEFESEPDMSQDERVFDIDDVITFFGQEMNSSGEIRRLQERLDEKFDEWAIEQVDNRWARDRREIVSDYIVNNDLESEKEEDETFEEFLDRKLDDDDFVDKVRDDFYDEEFSTLKQRDFFSDQNWGWASDVYDDFASEIVTWPHWTERSSSGGTVDAEDVANDFERSLKVPVLYSRRYHGGTSASTTMWRVEPDSSISPDDDGDGGLEFITPASGLPLGEMITKMEEVRTWAEENGCYTNRSTGLHINVSVPDTSSITVDYVKLVLLLGDNYILNLFNRQSNSFAKSSFNLLTQQIKSNPTKAVEVLDKMKRYLAHLGATVLQKVNSGKYVSVHFKGNYVEFRSPGGDWLNEKYWSQVKNTVYRFVVALDAATKPEKYREEYLKKLYKLIAPEGKELEMGTLGKLIAGYISGEISRDFILQRYRSAAPQQVATNPTSNSDLPPGNTRYEVYLSADNQPVGTFIARTGDRESARLGFNSFLTRIGRSSPAGYGYREIA